MLDSGKGVLGLSKIPSPTSITTSSCPVSHLCAALRGLGIITCPLLDSLVVSICQRTPKSKNNVRIIVIEREIVNLGRIAKKMFRLTVRSAIRIPLILTLLE